MQALVDTPIWSLALRRTIEDLRPREQAQTTALRELIRAGRAQLVGPVRQELLSGIRQETKFRELRDYLRAFDEPILEIADYEEAAHIHNRCRARGVAGSAIDFLICAIAARRNWEILTADHDFVRYAKAFPLKLYNTD
jgi:hypothetical protein